MSTATSTITPVSVPVSGVTATTTITIASLIAGVAFNKAQPITSTLAAFQAVVNEVVQLRSTLTSELQTGANSVAIANGLIQKMSTDGVISSSIATTLMDLVSDGASFLDTVNSVATTLGYGSQVEAVETKVATGCLGCLTSC